MAENKKVEIDLSINTGKSENSLQAIKRELKELKAAAIDFGEGTAGFNEATRRAGELQDKLADVNGTIKALSGNTTENLTKSFSGVAQAGVGGFQAVIGAQALFGSKNKEVQETLVKLQGAMAFSQGLKEFANIGQAAKDFKVVLLSLIGTKSVETTATETNTVATTQNTASKEASAIASTILAVQNGIASAATTVLTTITTAFGVSAGVAWAIATGGIIVLVAAIVGLIVYFDEIKAKFDEFGVAGQIALTIILGPLYLLYEGLKALGEYFGVLDTDAEKSAEKRAAAEEKYKDKVEENLKKISAAQRQADVASGNLSQANADRQEAKEEFITNFKKAQIDARLAYEQSAGAEEDAVIKKNLDLQIKAISLEYSNKLGKIRVEEKKLADEAVKATEEKNNKIAEKNKAAGDKAQKVIDDAAIKHKQDVEKLDQSLLKAFETHQTEEAKIMTEGNNKKLELQSQFDKLTYDEQKTRKQQFDNEMASINEETRVKIEESEKKAKDKQDAIDADKLNKLQTFQQSVRDIEIAGMTEEAAAKAEVDDQLKADKKQLEDEYNALTDEEKIAYKVNYDNTILALEKEAGDKKVAITEETAKKEKVIRDRNKDFAVGSAIAVASIISDVAKSFAGKSEASQKRAFNIAKAANVAAAVMSTYQSANAAFASQLVVGDVTSPARAAVAAGVAVAAGLVNVAKIVSTKFEAAKPPGDTGGGGGGGGGLGSGGGAVQGGNQAPTSLPTFNLTGQTIGGASNMLGSGAGGGGQQPVKVFVTETDISSVQGKVNVIQGNSLFGG
jgi:hypothetical protein